MIERLRDRQEWALTVALFRATPGLATAWFAAILIRGAVPAAIAVISGQLIRSITDGDPLGGPLTALAVLFVMGQVLGPLHQAIGANLGSRTANHLNERLLAATCGPPGIAHLEDKAVMDDLTLSRDFDLGINGPPLYIAMDFISGSFVEAVSGVAAAVVLFGFGWWPPLLLAFGWSATHWLLRESSVWKDRQTPEVLHAQRHADYAYRLAVDPPAAKEVRLFGLAPWVIDRFTLHRRKLYDLQYAATRIRERPLAICIVLVTAANLVVFYSLADGAADGRLTLAQVVVYVQAAIGVSAIAFGGLNWALDGAAAPCAAVARFELAVAARDTMPRGDEPANDRPASEIRFREVTFSYGDDEPVILEGFDLTIPAGSSLTIVGQNGAGKTTLAKLLCRLYDPSEGRIEIDGTDLRRLDLESWRERLTAVFQDFVRFELPLRENVAPSGADEGAIDAALRDAGGDGLASLDTVLSKGYPGGTELSGGQWQRVALARALCAVRTGAGVVLLDEPTAQLDVRGEAEIFERILTATRHCTTILISHRFSTVRHADKICVLEHGKVVELGSHDELMKLGGRYRTMFELQASHFAEPELDDQGEEVVYDVL